MSLKIPSSSIVRISLYYRELLSLKNIDVISSQRLSSLTECGAAQIRKDLAYFGQFGRSGAGYKVKALKEELRKILGIDKNWPVVLVGIGDLGSALLAYKGFSRQGFYIKYAFDKDKNKINRIKDDVRIKNIKELGKIIKTHKVRIGVVAVPQSAAQEVVDTLVGSGIKAILNFAPCRPKVPESVKILNIDLTIELEKLTYFLQRNG
jgi:redox-sensing transcriptional repressor